MTIQRLAIVAIDKEYLTILKFQFSISKLNMKQTKVVLTINYIYLIT